MRARTTFTTRRIVRRAAACTSVAAAIAAGGYTATTTFGADSYDATPPAAYSDPYVNPSPEVMREMDRTIRALYGPARERCR
jgi:hypothetical protein